MEDRVYTITSGVSNNVFIHAWRGHFVAGSSHLNWYIGTSDCKHNHSSATDAAMLLSNYYRERSIDVDTVLCLYETQVLGAYLVHELARPNMLNPNPNESFTVIGSEYDAQGNLIFRDNLKKFITGHKVLILMSCITTGGTAARAMESVRYYGGEVVGVSAIFSAVDNVDGIEVNSIFGKEDVPSYERYSVHGCPLCKANQKIDAVSNGYGYSTL